MANLRANSIVGVASTNSGVTFEGPIKIKTQNYFYLPTGNTFKRNVIENVVENGLVLYLDAGTSTSYSGTGTTWADLSGNGNNGTLVNGPTYSSANGGSLVFDGVNDRVSTNYKPSGVRSYFIWVRFSSLTHLSGYQLTGTQEVNAYTYIGIQNGGNVYYYAGTNGGAIANSVAVNTWVNLGFTLSSDGSRKVYKNGVEIFSGAGGLGVTATAEFSVGCVNQNHFVTGNIAQVQIHNRALTPEEISQNFNALRSRYGI